MLFISEQIVKDFYAQYQLMTMEGEYLENGGEIKKDWTAYCVQDLLEVARHIVGADDMVTFTEAAAVHEVMSVLGCNVNMKNFKALAEIPVYKKAESKVLTSYADASLTKYKYYIKTGRPVDLDIIYEDFDKFLWMWTACILEIVIADCGFKEQEMKLMTEYLAEISTYVTAKFGKLYYISDNISQLLVQAQKLSCD